MKLNQAASAFGRRGFGALLQWHLGKSPAPPEITSRHTTHTARDQEKRKDGQDSSNYSRFLTPSWFGFRHCLWTHLETLLYNYSHTYALMSPNKKGTEFDILLTDKWLHSLPVIMQKHWNGHELPFIVLPCQVFRSQQPGRTCWAPEPCSDNNCSVLSLWGCFRLTRKLRF